MSERSRHKSRVRRSARRSYPPDTRVAARRRRRKGYCGKIGDQEMIAFVVAMLVVAVDIAIRNVYNLEACSLHGTHRFLHTFLVAITKGDVTRASRRH